jgi:integrase
LDDIDWAARWVTIRPETSKSGYQRTVMFSHATGELLKRYLWNERASILAALAPKKDDPN